MGKHSALTFEDVEGKKLLRAFEDINGETLLVFEGPLVIVLEARETWSGEDPTIDYAAFHIVSWLQHADELVKLGVVTQQDIDDANNEIKQRKAKELEWRKAELERMQKELEEN